MQGPYHCEKEDSESPAQKWTDGPPRNNGDATEWISWKWKQKVSTLTSFHNGHHLSRASAPFYLVDATRIREKRRYVSVEDPVLARRALIRYRGKTYIRGNLEGASVNRIKARIWPPAICQDDVSSIILLEDHLFRDGYAAVESRWQVKACISTHTRPTRLTRLACCMFACLEEVATLVMTTPLAPG